MKKRKEKGKKRFENIRVLDEGKRQNCKTFVDSQTKYLSKFEDRIFYV